MVDQPKVRPPQRSVVSSRAVWDSETLRKPARDKPPLPREGASGGFREAAFLDNIGVADDEPTQLGQAVDVIGVERILAKGKLVAAASDAKQPVAESIPAPAASAEAAVQPGFVKVVATVAEPPEGVPDLPFVSDADSPIAASFRVLRHLLREADNPSVIAITSPDRYEGKTTCAINLAMALAEHGREKVLLVEANLRCPGLAAALAFVTPSCFGRQMAVHLQNPIAPWEAVAAFFQNLHVLTVDPASVGQFRLTAPAFKVAMYQLRTSGYKHIVIDCPSALGSADVNVIEDSADGVLLTARAGKTTSESLKKTERHLAPANILGVVLMELD